MATLSQIKSPVWTYSINGGGAIAEGLEAIRQCIDIIIRTTKGTDPTRPLFGSDVYKYQDDPIPVAIPRIKKAIIDAINTWETRVIISYIYHDTNISALTFRLGYQLVDSTLSDSLSVTIGNSGISTGVAKSRLSLQGLFPPNPSNFQYQVSCVLNGADILPAPSDNGFADTYELYTWIKENWLNYGQWFLTSNSIVGYINSSYTTGSLTISILTKNKFQGGIPALPIGYKYIISINVDGTVYTNQSDLFTPEQVRQWAQDNLGDLGLWQIVTSAGSFNEDFNDDFEIYLQVLVIYTSQATNVIINISTVTQ